ncbi:minor structural protein [Maize rough dwarf virus]|uniref:Minor structural protein n=1 Tax=Maize rough dwarf virus TaxID=10989 RepID=A0A0R4TCQ2_MRDV|nr:minor structural protein [Maize rough dwarf virus]AEA35035.1 minor structural protein [Maize rough dwarf virus]
MTYSKVKMTTDPSEMSLKKVLFDPTNEIRILNHEQADNTLLTTMMIIHDFSDSTTRDSVVPQIAEMAKNEFKQTIDSIVDSVSTAFVEHYHEIISKNAKLGNPLSPNFKNVLPVTTCIPGLETLYVEREKWELLNRLYRLNKKLSQKYPLDDLLKGRFFDVSTGDETKDEYISTVIIILEVFLGILTINSIYGGAIFSILILMTEPSNYLFTMCLLLHSIVQVVKIYLGKRALEVSEEKPSYVAKVKNDDIKDVLIDDTMFIFANNTNEDISQYFDISFKVHTHKSSEQHPFRSGFISMLTKITKIQGIKEEVKFVGYLDGVSKDELVGASGKKLSASQRHAIGTKYDDKTQTLIISHPILKDAFSRLEQIGLLKNGLLSKDDFLKIPADFTTIDFSNLEILNSYVNPFAINADLRYASQMSYNWKSLTTEKRPYQFLKEGMSVNFYDPIFECFFPNHFIKAVKKDAIAIDPERKVGYEELENFAALVEKHDDYSYNRTDAYSILKFLHEGHHSCGCAEYFAGFISDYLTSIEVLNHIKDSKLSKLEYHLKQEYESLLKKTRRQDILKMPVSEHSDYFARCAYNESFFDIDFCFLTDGECHSLVVRFTKRKPYFRFKDDKLDKLNVLSLYDLVVNCNHGELSSASRVGWNLVDLDSMGSDENLGRITRRPSGKTRQFTYDLMMINFHGSVTQYVIPEWLGESITLYEEKHEGTNLFMKSSLFSTMSCLPVHQISNYKLIKCFESSSNKLVSFMDGVISAMSTSLEFSPFKNTVLNNLKKCTQTLDSSSAKAPASAGPNRSKSFRSYLRSSRPNHIYDKISTCIAKKQNGMFSSEEMCVPYTLRNFGRLGINDDDCDLSDAISSREELYNNHPCALRLRNIGHFVFGKHFRCKACRNNYGTSFELSLCQLGHHETAIETVRSNTITSQSRTKLQPSAT